MPKDFVTEIDRAVREHQAANPEPRRGHLGASALGGRCLRQTWYAFRWAYEEQHTGRILRLFSRGHEEEHRFNKWLRMAGCEVQDYATRLEHYNGPEHTARYQCASWDEPVTPYWEDVSDNPHHIALATEQGLGPKQWGFVDHEGHFAGSSDGRVRSGLFPEEWGWGLVEEKTHNDKSFKQLTSKGVLTSKPVHYVQMQIYMHYMKLSWAVYLAVNKNDDSLYVEIVQYKPELALQYIERAGKIILQQQAPQRLTKDPSWWECKFCAFREICHYGDAPMKNCRSCVFAVPLPDGEWGCNKHGGQIPKTFVPQGCGDWEPIQ